MKPLPRFEDVTFEQLESGGDAWLDALQFGVIGIAPDGLTDRYNATESRLAGLSPERVLGRHFFNAVGICMNNYLVSQRFQDAEALDATIDYVLTFRMKPTPVLLRMLQRTRTARGYLLIKR